MYHGELGVWGKIAISDWVDGCRQGKNATQVLGH
jgi:hypothetical protein